MPDYAGAVQAIKDRLEDEWSSTVAPVAWVNDPAPTIAALQDSDAPWILGEVLGVGRPTIVGAGTPGDQVWRYDGLIHLHVMVPVGSGDVTANQHAVDLGDIFRNKEFYNGTPGFAVRTWEPGVGDGSRGDDDGKWWRVTSTTRFEYWHRG